MQMTAREILDRLVAFPTISSDSNLALINFVSDYLVAHGIAPVRVPHPTQPKAALYAHVGPDVNGGVVLSGHSDIVPTAGQDWTSDPFTVTERDGKLFGRGTCDMKGFVALTLAALPLAKAHGIKRPLQFALSYDEEIGMMGAPPMIDHMIAHGMARASGVIVGEPTNMKIVNAHNGGFGYQVHVHGYEIHSSRMHEGVSAVMMAARLVEWANRMNDDAVNRTRNPLAATFVPPYTTIHVGTINGGTAVNITAKDCTFEIDFRVVPGEDFADWIAKFETEVAAIDAKMKSVRPETGITYVQDFYAPGLAPEANGAAERLVRNLTGEDEANVVSFLTEGGLFQERGYSTIVCGPGSIEQAHQPDEFITLDQFSKGEAFMTRLIETLAQ